MFNIRKNCGGGGTDIKIAGSHLPKQGVLLSEILCNTSTEGESSNAYTIYVGMSPIANIGYVYVTAHCPEVIIGTVTLRVIVTATYTYGTSINNQNVSKITTLTLSSEASNVSQKISIGDAAAVSISASLTSVSIVSNTTGKGINLDYQR